MPRLPAPRRLALLPLASAPALPRLRRRVAPLVALALPAAVLLLLLVARGGGGGRGARRRVALKRRKHLLHDGQAAVKAGVAHAPVLGLEPASRMRQG